MTSKQNLQGLKEAQRAAWGILYEAVEDANRVGAAMAFLSTCMRQSAHDDPTTALILALAGYARRAHAAMRTYTNTESRIEDIEYKLGQRLARKVVKHERAVEKQKPALLAARRSRKAVRRG